MDNERVLLAMNNTLLTMLLYMLVTERNRAARTDDSSCADPRCAYCEFESGATGAANIRRSVTAHIRQMHPDQWREITSC